MLEKRIRSRASSFCDGGRSGGNAERAKISFRSLFVLSFQNRGRLEIARLSAIVLVASFQVTSVMQFSLASDPRLVSSSSEGCATRMAEGADIGSDPASKGAMGSELLFQTPPASLVL